MSAGRASPSPGQGGMVTQRNRKSSDSSAENWNAHPVGITSESPGATGSEGTREGSSTPGGQRQTCPLPCRMYQTSSTVRWYTGLDTCPAGRVTSTMLAPTAAWRWSMSRRISEPSGAITSGSAERWLRGGIAGILASGSFISTQHDSRSLPGSRHQKTYLRPQTEAPG